MTTLWALGDSIMRGYFTNQWTVPADYALHDDDGQGGGNSMALMVWHALPDQFDDVRDVAQLGYSMGTYPEGTPGFIGGIESVEINPVLAVGEPGDTVIIEGGTNDLGNIEVSAAEALASIQARCISLMNHGFARVMLWAIPPRQFNEGYPWDPTKEARRQQVNTWIRGSAVADGYATQIFDPEPLFPDPDDTAVYFDGLHYTRPAYQALARAMADALAPSARPASLLMAG